MLIPKIWVPKSPFATPLIRMVLCEKIASEPTFIPIFINGVIVLFSNRTKYLKNREIREYLNHQAALQSLEVGISRERYKDSEVIWLISRRIFKVKKYLNSINNKICYNENI